MRHQHSSPIRIADVQDIPEGMKLHVFIPEHQLSLLVCRVKGQIYCIENRCSHRDIPLITGQIEDCMIHCPLHGARFDLETGNALCRPASKPIASYPVQIIDDGVFIVLSPEHRLQT